MKPVILSILIAISLISVATQSFADKLAHDDIDFEFSISKTTFTIGEKIPCTIKITNTSKKDIYIDVANMQEAPDNYSILGCLYSIIDESGKQIKLSTGQSSFSIAYACHKLAPGKQIVMNDYVNVAFKTQFKPDKPGVYEITASIKPSLRFYKDAPDFHSDPIKIKVQPPAVAL